MAFSLTKRAKSKQHVRIKNLCLKVLCFFFCLEQIASGGNDDASVLGEVLDRSTKTSKSKKKSKKLTCSSDYQCITQAKRGVGWYNANNQTWGFVRGSLSFVVNPCDGSDLDSNYRLCWTSQTVAQKGAAGDRCGNEINLQNSTKWERLIYKIV